jgi:hypothetical protein
VGSWHLEADLLGRIRDLIAAPFMRFLCEAAGVRY